MMDQDELIRICIKESQAHLESMESGLHALKEFTGKPDPDDVRSILTRARNIKGASKFYNFSTISSLADLMGQLLLRVMDNQIDAEPDLINALLDGTFALREMLADIESSNEYDITHVMTLLNRYAGSPDKQAKTVVLQEMAHAGKPPKTFIIQQDELNRIIRDGRLLYTLTFLLKQDVTDQGKTPFDMINAVNTYGEFLESSMDIGNIQGLADCLENEFSFTVLFATTLPPERISGNIGLPRDRVIPIDMTAHLQQPEPEVTDTLYLTPETDLVASRIESLRDLFAKKLNENPTVQKVVLKADHVQEVDSLGVNLIIGIYRQVTGESKSFEITGAKDRFMKVANFFRFPALFTVTPEEEK